MAAPTASEETGGYYLWGDFFSGAAAVFLTIQMDAHCETGAELIHIWLSSVDNNNNTLIITTPPPLLPCRSQGRGAQGVRGERPLLERWV